jgi:hypothetical protein
MLALKSKIPEAAMTEFGGNLPNIAVHTTKPRRLLARPRAAESRNIGKAADYLL